MVNPRGGKRWVDDASPAEEGAAPTRTLKAFLEEEQLERYPRAGVIVATSGDQETHEWSRYHGGILSHELRSALSGAADVNGDGRIEYSELRAFLAAANARVQEPRGARRRLRARARARSPPRARRSARRRRRSARFLHFGAGLGRPLPHRGRPRRALRRSQQGARRRLRRRWSRRATSTTCGARERLTRQEAEARAGAAPRRGRAARVARARHRRARRARCHLPPRSLSRAVRPRLLRRLRRHLGRSRRRGEHAVRRHDADRARAAAPSPLGRLRALGRARRRRGLSNGVDVRYAYRFWRALDLGLAGAGRRTAPAPRSR